MKKQVDLYSSALIQHSRMKTRELCPCFFAYSGLLVLVFAVFAFAKTAMQIGTFRVIKHKQDKLVLNQKELTCDKDKRNHHSQSNSSI